MKKSILLFLSVCAMVFAVSCSNGLDADASQSGAVNPAATIKDNEGERSLTSVADFINEYAGVYYSQGLHYYKHDNSSDTGYKVDYKFRNGKVYTYNQHNEGFEVIVEPVEAVLASQRKAQLRHKDKGEVLVLNMTDDGLESYVSYILEKVSDEVLIQNSGVGGHIKEFAEYKGTYNSLAADNKIENYIAIDEEGNVYFHDSAVTVDSGRVGITENELTILESYQYTMRKIIFKFDEGVYRRYSIDGEHRDETYIGICEVAKEFIEDKFNDAFLSTDDFKELEGLYEGTYEYTPTKVQGYSLRLNEPADDGYGSIIAEGAVCFTGNVGSKLAARDNVIHISALKGNTLHIMGKYNAAFEFSPDWKTATYNGQTLTLRSGEIKATAAPAERRANRRIK